MASSYAALAAALRGAGRCGEALTYTRCAAEAKERAFPPGHPEIAGAVLAFADALREQARHVALHVPSCMHFPRRPCLPSAPDMRGYNLPRSLTCTVLASGYKLARKQACVPLGRYPACTW